MLKKISETGREGNICSAGKGAGWWKNVRVAEDVQPPGNGKRTGTREVVK
jgi:hypothetical protein